MVPTTTVGNLITLDGTFSDWPAADIVTTPANVVAGYQVYGAFLNDATLGNTYVIGIDATASTDPVIGPGTIIYLNTDQNNTTGYELSFGNVGAEYEVQFAYGSNAELAGLSVFGHTRRRHHTAQRRGAARLRLLQQWRKRRTRDPAGVADAGRRRRADLDQFRRPDNGAEGLPANFASNPEYTITDPATLLPKTATHRVAIVYSDTTAALYFRGLGDAAGAPSTAYSDLFMAAQNQARMAGVSYDVIENRS